MEDLLNQLIALLGGSGNVVAVLASVVLILFRDRILDALERLGLPVKPFTPAVPDDDADETDDVERWLDEHPLLNRLWVRLKEKFSERVLSGDEGEDEVYAELLAGIRDSHIPWEVVEDETGDDE